MASSKHSRVNGKGNTPASQRVENFIRECVYRGHLHPRERIIEGDLARQLNVSRGTVREALLRLDRDGLVVTTPRRGTYIRDISGHELKPLFDIRGKLESLCVRYLRQAPKQEIEGPLRKALATLKAAALSSDEEKFFQADMDLHLTIWKLSGQPQLIRILKLVMSPFIFLIARTYSPGPIRERFESHKAYVEMIMRTPLNRVESEVERYFEELYQRSFQPHFPSFDTVDDVSWLQASFNAGDSS